MKKELVILNELKSLFKEERSYKITYTSLFGLNKGDLLIEIEYTEEELFFIKNTIRNKVIDGHGILLGLPTMYSDGEPLNKCFNIIFVEEHELNNLSESLNDMGL